MLNMFFYLFAKIYLIKLPRSLGMSERKLHKIFVAFIVSRVSYALSAWGGFVTGQEINRINVFFRKVRRFGLCSPACVCNVSEYLSLVDGKLFKSIQTSSHCLSNIGIAEVWFVFFGGGANPSPL